MHILKLYKTGLYTLVVMLLLGGLQSCGNNQKTTPEKEQHEYTCSMHPQIRKEEPGKCPICGMELIPVDQLAQAVAPGQFSMGENAMALANIQTFTVGGPQGGGATNLQVSGTLVPNKEASTVQASYFEGRLERLHVDYEGQELHKGQLLATLYSPELITAQQELLTAATLKKSQPALYEAVRNKLKFWKLSEQQIQQIESSGKVMEYFPIYATVSGTVAEVLVAEGDYVKKGQPLLKVNNLGSLWAEFDVYEDAVPLVSVGQSIALVAQSRPTDTIQAKVSFIDPVLDPGTRTVTMRAELPNRDGKFKPGMFVTAGVGMASKEGQQLWVPASAVLWTGTRSVVYVKPDPNKPVFELREVTVGNQQGERVPVVSGLKAGEEVVMNGTFTVDAAAQLQGARSMMSHPAETASKGMMAMKMEVPEGFQKELKTVLPSYMKLKEALVASDAQAVALTAKGLKEKLDKIDAQGPQGMVKAHWAQVKSLSGQLATSTSLEAQRQLFVNLNENLVALVSHISPLDSKIYVMRCPMANKGEGALWMSWENVVKNPYFGAAMLDCGSVVQELE